MVSQSHASSHATSTDKASHYRAAFVPMQAQESSEVGVTIDRDACGFSLSVGTAVVSLKCPFVPSLPLRFKISSQCAAILSRGKLLVYDLIDRALLSVIKMGKASHANWLLDAEFFKSGAISRCIVFDAIAGVHHVLDFVKSTHIHIAHERVVLEQSISFRKNLLMVIDDEGHTYKVSILDGSTVTPRSPTPYKRAFFHDHSAKTFCIDEKNNVTVFEWTPRGDIRVDCFQLPDGPIIYSGTVSSGVVFITPSNVYTVENNTTERRIARACSADLNNSIANLSMTLPLLRL